jgi:hypothetical protein
MKYIKTLILLILLLNTLFSIPTFSDVPTSNLNLVTERYLEAIEAKAEYKARKESLEGELLYLRIQNIALFLVVGYMATK